MSEREYAKIISRNLRRIMYENNKTQAEVAKDLHLNKATVSSWMNGTRIPRIPNIDMLCHYFNVTRAEIMEEPEVQKTGQVAEYYNPETLEMAQAIYENPQLRALMKAAMDTSTDSMESLTSLLNTMKGTNPDG